MAHAKLIQLHLAALKNIISDPNTLLDICYSKGVITRPENEDLMSQKIPSLMISNLLKKVQSKGEGKYNTFLDCLLETEHEEAHALLTSTVTTSTSGLVPRATQLNTRGQSAVKCSKIASLVSKDPNIANKLEEFADSLGHQAAEKVSLLRGVKTQATNDYSACTTIIQSWVGKSPIGEATVGSFIAKIQEVEEFKRVASLLLADYPAVTIIEP